MTPPAWTRNKTKYKKYPKNNGSVNVVHFSPGKPKVTIRVPKSNASNVPAFLRKYYAFKPPPGLNVRHLSGGKVMVVRNNGYSEKSIVMPKRNPTNKNIQNFIKTHFAPVPLTSAFLGPPMNAPYLTAQLSPNWMKSTVGKNMKANNFWQNSTANGRTGTALTSMNKTGLRTIYNVSKGIKSVRKGIAKLGGGEQATVYLGYYDKAAKRPVSLKVFPLDKAFPANKQPAEYEFKIGQKVHEVAPTHTPKYTALERSLGFAPLKNFASIEGPWNARSQLVILSEYFHGGDLKTWLQKVSTRIDESTMMDIIRQVISTIVKIQDKYPGFRHNDLHTGNIFIDDTGNRPRAAIADFGLARLSPTLSNPIVNKGLFIRNGIGPATSSRYDAHLFLNSLWPMGRRFPQLKQYLETVLPPGYRGQTDTYVKDSRLKYGMEYPGLPSTKEMLKILTTKPNKVYPKGTFKLTPTNLVRARKGLKPLGKNITHLVKTIKPNKVYPKGTFKLTPSNLAHARQMLKPLNGKANCTHGVSCVPKGTDAANIAAQALQGVKGVAVTKMSAANFLKLSPKSKAAMMKAGPKKKPATLQFKKLTQDPTASKKTNVGAYAKILLEKKKSPESYNLNKLFKTPVQRKLRPAKNLLNAATHNKNVNALTVRQLRTVLERYSYSKANAKREARAWANAWAARVGKRRGNLGLTKGNNGRVRAGKKLLETHKKDELVAMARKHGLKTNGKTKEQLIRSLWLN